MQAYEGFFVEQGKFIPLDAAKIPVRKRAIVTILDEPIQDDTMTAHLVAIDDFIASIEASDEAVPDFERIRFDLGEGS